jgi:hypothetical protein
MGSYATKTDETKRRGTLMNGLTRLHKSIDRIRCDEMIVRECLDPVCDEMLILLEEIIARVPAVTRMDDRSPV